MNTINKFFHRLYKPTSFHKESLTIQGSQLRFIQAALNNKTKNNNKQTEAAQQQQWGQNPQKQLTLQLQLHSSSFISSCNLQNKYLPTCLIPAAQPAEETRQPQHPVLTWTVSFPLTAPTGLLCLFIPPALPQKKVVKFPIHSSIQTTATQKHKAAP